jgi:hexulose-6-phosphate isomerase
MSIGIMQGRLLPPEPGRVQAFPRSRWQQEFPLASAAGFEFIEWIYDFHGEDVNPIANDEGIQCMRRLALEHGIQFVSLCADYFKDLGILEPAKLVWLLERCRSAGISRVVLPLLEAAHIQTPEQIKRTIAVLRDVLPEAARNEVEIALETALAPAPFAALLEALPHPSLKVNYDSGNSAAQGYSLTEEFAVYGNRIGAIHIKDKLLDGASVPLGTGVVDFSTLFRTLKQIDYRGDFVFEAVREDPGNAQRNISWLRSWL